MTRRSALASATQGQRWWQVAVTCEPAAEERVAELLWELFQEQPSIYVDQRTGGCRVTVYLPGSRPNTTVVRSLRAGLRACQNGADSHGGWELRIARLRNADWAESWKRHFSPLHVGKALLIRPSWSTCTARQGQQVVVLDPGLAFGTGHHPTTIYCLRQIVRERDPEEAQSFLDAGTGSAILAIAAAKLGYGPVEAFDYDPAAVAVAAGNIRRNRVSRRITLACSDLDALPARTPCQYDLVCANLIYDVLLRGRKKLVGRVTPRGKLVLAGILQTQFGAVRDAYEQLGMRMTSYHADKEWASGTFGFA